MPRGPSWADSVRSLARFAAPEVGGVFSLGDVYAHETALARRYPENSHVRENIRDVLQELRDAGEIQFLGGGRYRRMK